MRRSLGAALALLAALTSSTLTARSATAEPAAPLRILIIGVYVGLGSSGDWTWRYRLWEMLRSSGVSFDLVGPHDDLFDNRTYALGSQEYADPDFDRDHAARWGMAMAFPDIPIADLMADYRPDVVIETRGYNDLTWLEGRPAELLAAMAEEVADARAVDPSVDCVLGQLPQVWKPNVSTFNAALPALAAAQSQPGSPVVAAATGTGFVEGVDTWDIAHYSATGEVRFAAAIADSLAALGVGDGAGTLPTVSNGHWGGAVLEAEPGERSASLTWDDPPGASAEYIWRRDQTLGDAWVRLAVPVSDRSWTARGLVEGHRYQFRLQATKGSIVADGYSNVAEVVPTAPPVPGRPSQVVVAPGLHRLDLTWAPVPGATAYDVSWVGRKLQLRGQATVASPAAAITNVLAGERYDVTVTARNGDGWGPAATVVGVPRGPTVAAPARLRARQTGAHRALLTWRHRAAASSYSVEVRRRGHWAPVRTVVATALVVRGLPRGVARFRVRPWHQFVAGRWSHEVRVRMQ